jgi:hypothetical protein
MMAAQGKACAINLCYDGFFRADNQRILNRWAGQDSGYFFKCMAPVDDECHTMTSFCQSVQQACVGASATFDYPFCSLGCKQQIDQDQTIMVDVNKYSKVNLQPVVILPQKFLAVGNTRSFWRTTTFASLESNLGAGRLVWRYQVPQVADVLEESFSPNLFVSRVRAFTSPNPASFARSYLELSGITIDQGAISCAGSSADATVVSSDDCPSLGVTTPSYVQSASSQNAPAPVWRIKLLDGTHGGNPGLTSNTPVFIEFTLANRTGTGGNVVLRTASWQYAYNFGVLPSGAQRTDLGALKLDLGESAVRWYIEQVSTSGHDAQEFSLQVEGPSPISAGGVRNVDVTFSPASDGVKVAFANVTLRDSGGNHKSIMVNLQAESGAQSMNLIPPMLNFNPQLEFDPNTGLPLPLPWQRWFFVENIGTSPLIRQTVTITGPDAASFTVYEGASGSSMPPAVTLASAEAEGLRVDFCPARYGTFSAQISIEGNEGTMASPIVAIKNILLQAAVHSPNPLCGCSSRPCSFIPR